MGADAGPVVPGPRRVRPEAEGFDRVADRYERGRPEYPAEAVARLVGALRLGPSARVVDLGAGTGKLTRALRLAGLRPIAVEPGAGMRAEFVRHFPDVELHEGTAESLPFDDASVDAVVCGQSFHWFDVARAAAEIARVLRPSGGLALVWNRRDERVPWVADLTRVLDRRSGAAPRVRDAAWREPLESSRLFDPLEQEIVEHTQTLTHDVLVDRVLSVSFIALLPPHEQAAVVAEVDTLLATSPATRDRSTIVLPYRTEVYWTRRRRTP